MIKIDTEGHDVVILHDLDPKLRPPIMWVEWFREYKFFIYDKVNKKYSIEVKLENINCALSNIFMSKKTGFSFLKDDGYCTQNSAKLFKTIVDLGYEIFAPEFPLRKIVGCANRYYKSDLLLVSKEFIVKNKIKYKNQRKEYKIRLYPKGYDD